MSWTQVFVKYASVLGVALSVHALIMIIVLALSAASSVFTATIVFLGGTVMATAFVVWRTILTNPPDSGWFR